ncbi:hypothetical protein NCG89_00015 [Spongiibacter taiwanensis]|uniref:FimV/HubP family polar landmark protein n=1 Tax=Spongiibacter taiwanensis TaxID=1748242 RepID=UPI002034F783|nr:FimV/HubP family polar landmark protein [Spongiibacter taiwanensis]USA43192.1 hypothetical protein NCG89_00015 [Spongiibacter taiwanensis]
MVRTKLASAVFVLTALQSGLVSALGLGELDLDSALNQPFRATIPLSDVGNLSAEQIRVNLADNQAFENAGVDRSQFLSALKFDVQLDPNGRGRIVVTSQDMVVEPYLDFIIEARWPNGRILREYTVLLDLPNFNDAPARSVAAPVSGGSAAAPGRVEPRAAGPVMRNVTPPPAPGLAPRPAPQQESLPPSSRPNTYRVQHHDTMWKLATKLKPSAFVSTEQTMIALLEKNPNAFIGDNVNRIKSGYVLQLPSEAEAKAVSHRDAQAEIQRQDDEWRGKVAPKKSSAAASAASAPQLSGASDDSGVTGGEAGAAKFSISSAGEGDPSGESAQLRESLRAAEEEAEKAKLESSAMQQRVVAMEEQIATLKSLIQLKNNQLAALQAGESAPAAKAEEQALADQLQASQEKLAEAEQPADADRAGATEDSLAEAGDSVASESASDSESTANGERAVQSTAAAAAKPSADKPAAVNTPAPAAESWFSNRLIWLLGAVLAVLTLIVLWLRQRSDKREEEEDLSGFEEELAPLPAGAAALADEAESTDENDSGEFAQPDDFAEEDVFAAVAGLDGDDDVTEKSEETFDAPVQPQMGDPAAEADIYAAYGRYDQAESLLKNAIAQEPDDSRLRVKLIDIYLETRNREAFDEAYADLAATGDTEAVAQVKESMSALEGVSDWLRSDNTDDVIPDTAGLTNELELDEEGLDINEGLDIAESPDPEAAGDVAIEDVGLGANEIAFEEQAFGDDQDTDEAETSFTLDEVNEADGFALDEVEDAASALPGDSGTAAESAGTDSDAEALASLDDDLSGLDFDFDLDETSDPVETAGEAPSVSETASFDETLDVTEALQAESETEFSAAPEVDPGAFEDAVDDLEEVGGVNDLLAAADAESDGELNLELSGNDAFAPDSSVADENDELSLELDDLDMASLESEPIDPLAMDSPAIDSDEAEPLDMVFDGDLNSPETDFNADLSEPEVGASDDASVQEAGGQESDAEQISAESSPFAPEAAPDTPMDLQDIVFDEFDADLGEGGDDSELLSDDDQVSTKLGLARAYVDMGDNEGARDILDEVLQEGSDAQKQEAQALLDQM